MTATGPSAPDLAATLSDPEWRSLHDFLTGLADETARLVVPAPLHHAFPGAICPQDMADPIAQEFAAIAIHKGDYTSIPADSLYPLLILYRPVFANAVFIVLAPSDRAGAAADRAHTGALTAMIAWARTHASPALVAATTTPHAELSADEALTAMARLIARDLVQQVSDDSGLVAVAETALPFAGTRWFWGDDAGKVAELFCLPTLAAEQPDLASRLIDLVMALSPAGLIHRRIGPADLRVESDDPRDLKVATPFTITFGDLSRGRIQQAIRFNDGRTRPIVCFVPGTLTASWRGRPVTCDLAAAIFAQEVTHDGDSVMLRHVSTIRDPGDVTRELATVTCTYSLAANRSIVGFELAVRPARFVTLKDITVTPGLGDLDQLGHFDTLTTLGSTSQPHIAPALGSLPLSAAAMPYLCLWESRSLPGHAVGVHMAPADTATKLSAVTDDERLTGLRLHYRSRAATRRTPFVVRDTRLVTTGGYYDRAAEYRDLIHDAGDGGWCRDPSMSYDTGVELNAVATWLFFASTNAYGTVPPDRMTTLRAWYDRHLSLYRDHLRPDDPNVHERIFVRGLAFVILSLDTIARVHPDAGYDRLADRLTNLLLDTQTPVAGDPDAAVFGSGLPDAPWRPELDSQCAALLALGRRACTEPPSTALAAAIAAGVTALRIATPSSSSYGNDPLDHPTIVISRSMDDDDLVDTGFWTYKLGLALRAFHLIDHAATTGRLALPDATRAHLQQLAATATQALLRAADYRDGLIEVRTSFNAGETNSETQPWAALGLVPLLDRALLDIPAGEALPLSIAITPKA